MGHMHHRGHEMMMGEGHKPFYRKFWTKDEKKEWLSNYVEDPKKELEAAEEKPKEL